MPFPFTLSTTSQLAFQSHLTSSTHPSLPTVTTSQRSVVRAALKSHKRLSPTDQSNNLSQLISTITIYLKHLNSLDLALSGKAVSNEDVDIALTHEIEIEWRPTLSQPSIPGRDADRIKGRGLDFEIYFIHHTLAILHTLLARQSLGTLYASITPTAEARLSSIQAATKSLKAAFTLHTYLISRSSSDPPTFPPTAVDINPTLQQALCTLSHSELTLLAILKDDPYPTLLIQSSNPNDKDWMIRAPSIPKLRTQVLRRLCIGASNLASSALSLLKSLPRVSKHLLEYTSTLSQVTLAKSHRFAALDATLSNETGKAIAFLNAAFHALNIPTPDTSSGRALGLSKLKSTLSSSHSKPAKSNSTFTPSETNPDSNHKKSSPHSISTDPALESQILTYLHTTLTKEINTINVQLIPDWRGLTASLPSAMTLPVEEKWVAVVLEEGEIAGMRGLELEGGGGGGRGGQDGDMGMGESSGDEDDGEGLKAAGRGEGMGRTAMPGSFGGVGAGRGGEGNGSSYY